MSQFSTYPLRLPRSIRAGVDLFSQKDGISINPFVSIAVAEKLAMLQAQVYFAERSARADMDAFDQLMRRSTGAPPQQCDEI
jgi:hypothetical protein